MVFEGQDSFQLVQFENRQYLNNGKDQKELDQKTVWQMKVDKDGRAFLKDSKNQRLNAPRTFCDTLLNPVIDVKELTRRHLCQSGLPNLPPGLPTATSLTTSSWESHRRKEMKMAQVPRR